MSENYNTIPKTTATSTWHAVTVTEPRGPWIIQNWLDKNQSELTGGYIGCGERVEFEKAKDAMFCKLSIGGRYDQ